MKSSATADGSGSPAAFHTTLTCVSGAPRKALGEPHMPAPQPVRIETQGELHVPDRCNCGYRLLIRFSRVTRA